LKDHAPSVAGNRDAILAVLKTVLPQQGTILEVASGTGQHAVHFAPNFPSAIWQPSELRPEALASIRAWSAEAALPNLRDPVVLDVTQPAWPVESADAIVNINMLHISPWAACEGLFVGAARVLSAGGRLVYYGAFLRDDRVTAPSNLDFDRSLKARNPAWGVRELKRVVAEAESAGLSFERVLDMPNNNSVLILSR
jgi:hypothetical protein